MKLENTNSLYIASLSFTSDHLLEINGSSNSTLCSFVNKLT